MAEFAFIIAMTVLFLHFCTWEGNILFWLVQPLWSMNDFIKKPLYDCPVCMVPWWGSIFIILFCLHSGNWIDWFSWILLLTTAGGINAVASAIIEYVRNGDPRRS